MIISENSLFNALSKIPYDVVLEIEPDVYGIDVPITVSWTNPDSQEEWCYLKDLLDGTSDKKTIVIHETPPKVRNNY